MGFRLYHLRWLAELGSIKFLERISDCHSLQVEPENLLMIIIVNRCDVIDDLRTQLKILSGIGGGIQGYNERDQKGAET